MPADPQSTILTPPQRAFLAERAAKYHEDSSVKPEIERRHDVSRRFRELVSSSGVLEGSALTKGQLADIIRLEWEIQNLQALVIPKLIGTYDYYRHFKSFLGSEQDFVAHMSATRPQWKEGSTGHPGADLAALPPAPAPSGCSA